METNVNQSMENKKDAEDNLHEDDRKMEDKYNSADTEEKERKSHLLTEMVQQGLESRLKSLGAQSKYFLKAVTQLVVRRLFQIVREAESDDTNVEDVEKARTMYTSDKYSIYLEELQNYLRTKAQRRKHVRETANVAIPAVPQAHLAPGEGQEKILRTPLFLEAIHKEVCHEDVESTTIIHLPGEKMETDAPLQNTDHDLPCFSKHWQFEGAFSYTGGQLRGESSDIILTVPEGAVDAKAPLEARFPTGNRASRGAVGGETVLANYASGDTHSDETFPGNQASRDAFDNTTDVLDNKAGIEQESSVVIKGAISTNLDLVHKALKLSPREKLVSPVVEFSADPDVMFHTPVRISIPHFLPEQYSRDDVCVYWFWRDSTGMHIEKRKLQECGQFAADERQRQKFQGPYPEGDPAKGLLQGGDPEISDGRVDTLQKRDTEDSEGTEGRRQNRDPESSDGVFRFEVEGRTEKGLLQGGDPEISDSAEGPLQRDPNFSYASFRFQGRDRIEVLVTHFCGFVCGHCGETSPQLQLRLYGSACGRDVKIFLLAWDRRLDIKDFRENVLAKSEDEEKFIVSKSVDPPQDTSRLQLGAAFFMEAWMEQCWIHKLRPDGQPWFPALQVIDLTKYQPSCTKSSAKRLDWLLTPAHAQWRSGGGFECFIEVGFLDCQRESFLRDLGTTVLHAEHITLPEEMTQSSSSTQTEGTFTTEHHTSCGTQTEDKSAKTQRRNHSLKSAPLPSQISSQQGFCQTHVKRAWDTHDFSSEFPHSSGLSSEQTFLPRLPEFEEELMVYEESTDNSPVENHASQRQPDSLSSNPFSQSATFNPTTSRQLEQFKIGQNFQSPARVTTSELPALNQGTFTNAQQGPLTHAQDRTQSVLPVPSQGTYTTAQGNLTQTHQGPWGQTQNGHFVSNGQSFQPSSGLNSLQFSAQNQGTFTSTQQGSLFWTQQGPQAQTRSGLSGPNGQSFQPSAVPTQSVLPVQNQGILAQVHQGPLTQTQNGQLQNGPYFHPPAGFSRSDLPGLTQYVSNTFNINVDNVKGDSVHFGPNAVHPTVTPTQPTPHHALNLLSPGASSTQLHGIDPFSPGAPSAGGRTGAELVNALSDQPANFANGEGVGLADAVGQLELTAAASRQNEGTFAAACNVSEQTVQKRHFQAMPHVQRANQRVPQQPTLDLSSPVQCSDSFSHNQQT